MIWWLYILAGWIAVNVATPVVILTLRGLHAPRRAPQPVHVREPAR